MINTVIFDIGNVLIDFDWGEYVKELVPDKKTYETVRNAMFGEFWNEIDRGVLSDEEMLQGFTERAGGFEDEIRLAFAEVGRSLCRRGYAIPWIKELHDRGLRVLYLSNYSRHVMNANPEVLSFTEYMDGGIFSCEVKLIKPDPAVYNALLDKYSLIPSECVFIDDNPANIKAAHELGINTVHFRSYEQAYNELALILAKKEGQF